MIRFLLLGICVFSGVRSQGEKNCKSFDVCMQDTGNVNCHGDCLCRDSMVDECQHPNPTTAIHVNNIQECMNNCEVFALEGRCKFIIYHFDNIDENCLIMNDPFERYLTHCNEIGQPLWGQEHGEGIARWRGCRDDETCYNESPLDKNKCNTCTDCKDTGCRGYILSKCDIYSTVLESNDLTTFDNCEVWARTTEGGTYMHYDREQSVCQVYGGEFNEDHETGFHRVCQVAIVELGTDPQECGEVIPTLPPTTAPPDCSSDLDCKPDEICFNNLCQRGCYDDAKCGVHPCACTGECQDGVDPCHWCSGATPDHPGTCAPGCANNDDCEGDLICNGMHMCVNNGGTVLEFIEIHTKTCEGCALTNVEVGAEILMKGRPASWGNTTCIIENLDNPTRIDYQTGVSQTFASHDSELDTCNWANFNGYDMDMFSVKWKGEGKWNPSQIDLRFTGMTDPVICPYQGAALETGVSMNLKCARG